MSSSDEQRFASLNQHASSETSDVITLLGDSGQRDRQKETSEALREGASPQGPRDRFRNQNDGDGMTFVSPDGDRSSRELTVKTSRDSSSGPSLPEETKSEQQEPVTWRSLPQKSQLLVLALARLSEPLTATSLGTYIYFQLRSFDPSLPDSTISFQVGIVQAAFPAAQFLTAILWGRFADSEHGGRKRVIWFGLFGTMLSMIGFGFSQSFPMAVLFRGLGGVLNGNIGVMRTMISEIVKEKKYQPRAFTILPITFNIGVIIGPMLGGALANPVSSYPSLFGAGSLFGGDNGVQWMIKWPYALPNLVSAIFLFFSAWSVILFLEETSEFAKDKRDRGLRVGRWIRRHIFRQAIVDGYMAVATDEAADDVELQESPVKSRPLIRNKLPFRRIWTWNLITTLISHGLLAMHVGTFNSLWFTYLSAPRYDPNDPKPPKFHPHGFIHFTGGLALPSSRIGFALSIIGVMGIPLQLMVYPRVVHRLGTIKSYRIFLMLFPVSYAVVPFLSTVYSTVKPPKGASGPLIWICISIVLFNQVLARTFALPCTTILINNASPHPSALGTVHGIGQSVSSLTRTVGPILFGWLFGRGLEIGVVGLAWWILAIVAVVGSLMGRLLWEGDGHEILLEGEVKDA